MDWLSALAGLLVGTIVGLTGVGGGSLMSPILILMFGIAPVTAVGTDLWFAAITKTFGGAIHHRQQSADLGVVKLLCFGSIPAALLTLLWLSSEGMGPVKSGAIVKTLGVVLIITAVLTPFRGIFARRIALVRASWPLKLAEYQAPMTVAAGALLGFLVTLTSVGAGALGASLLLMLYPLRLTSRRLVGTDIVHAVPVALVGGIGHAFMGNVNLPLLGSLLVGSIPGIILGALLAGRVSDRVIQPLLALVMAFAGWKLLS